MRGVWRNLIGGGLIVALAFAGWMLAHGRSVPAQSDRPSSALSSAPPVSPDVSSMSRRDQQSPLPPGSSPGPGGHTAQDTGQLATALAEMAARSRGLNSSDLAQADQLVDLLPHLRVTCSSAEALTVAGALVDAATQCVSEAEAIMNVIGFLRETLASPAGERMPEVARRDWDSVLTQATSVVRDALIPVWDKLARERASGRASAATFRALGQVRDRIGRVLAEGPQ